MSALHARWSGSETWPAAPLALLTTSAADTRAVGGSLAQVLEPGDVVLLAGDLGTGKTTLTQGIAAGLGVVDDVTSPTFTLVRTHTCGVRGRAAATAVRTLLHADLYRLDRLHEVADLAIAEMVDDGAVAVVEWGDVAMPVLGDQSLVVELACGSRDDDRVLSVVAHASWGVRYDRLARALQRWAQP